MSSQVRSDWSVPLGGFVWTEEVLVEGDPPRRLLVGDGSRGERPYHPVSEHPALFRELAVLAPTEAAVLAFANRYGHLGIGGHLVSRHPELIGGEYLADWRHAISEMARAVDVWDAYRRKDRKELADLVPVKERNGWFLVKAAGRWHEIRPGAGDRIMEAARLALSIMVSDRIMSAYGTTLTFTRDLRLVAKPETLLAALWFQFILAMEENRDFGRCEHCTRWFLIKKKAPAKRFCRDSCRVGAHQKRKREGSVSA